MFPKQKKVSRHGIGSQQRPGTSHFLCVSRERLAFCVAEHFSLISRHYNSSFDVHSSGSAPPAVASRYSNARNSHEIIVRSGLSLRSEDPRRNSARSSISNVVLTITFASVRTAHFQYECLPFANYSTHSGNLEQNIVAPIISCVTVHVFNL